MIFSQQYKILSKRSNWIAILTTVVAFALIIWAAGLFYFMRLIPLTVVNNESLADSIIVLTGGSNRLKKGLQLLTQNKGKKLFISGVYRGNDVRKLLQVQKHNPKEVLCCINLGYEATSTHGNAVESKNWIEKNKFKSIRLVTANYHMPRSLFLFQQIMPEIHIIPHPVFPQQFNQSKWWSWPRTATLVISEYSKYIVAQVSNMIMSKNEKL